MTAPAGETTPGDERGEAELVRRAADGDMSAFEELVMRYADPLFASLRRFGLDEAEAQEVAQETFLRAWRALPRFEQRSRFYTWLYRIGFNEAQRRLARRPAAGVTVTAGEDALADVADARPGPAEEAEQEDLRRALARALGQLPPDLRVPVVLRDIEGLSTQEAASLLELGEPAFKSRLHRGRMALRGLLIPWLATTEP
ncbi:MAG: sigma-70 family RNA polymerase sigma factor [Solirubrobacteraceae bacterium]